MAIFDRATHQKAFNAIIAFVDDQLRPPLVRDIAKATGLTESDVVLLGGIVIFEDGDGYEIIEGASMMNPDDRNVFFEVVGKDSKPNFSARATPQAAAPDRYHVFAPHMGFVKGASAQKADALVESWLAKYGEEASPCCAVRSNVNEVTVELDGLRKMLLSGASVEEQVAAVEVVKAKFARVAEAADRCCGMLAKQEASQAAACKI